MSSAAEAPFSGPRCGGSRRPNLGAGELAGRIGRKRLLVAGWLAALPVPLLIGPAPSWWYIVAANLLR